MNLQSRLLLLIVFLLSGCVTTQTGDMPVASPSEEVAEINLQLGIGYLRQGNFELARAKLEKAIEQDPELATAHRVLGLVYQRMGDPAGAEKQYRAAVSLAPEDANALNSLAVFLCSQRDEPKEAMTYFDRAVKVPLFQQKAMTYTNAGVCAKKVDIDQAETLMRRALALDPTYPEALLQMGDIAFERGNYLQSRAFVERYLSARPPTAAVLWLGVQVEDRLQNYDASTRYGQILKQDFPESVEARMLLEQERNAG